MNKKDGSISYFLVPLVFLLLVVLIYVNIYMRSADTMSENYKSSIDTANLSVTTVNLPELLSKNTFSITGHVTKQGAMSPEEYNAIAKTFVNWENVLMSNIGLKNDFSFSGGTCGWAGSIMASGPARVDSFTLYDFVLDQVDGLGQYHYHVYKYKISDVNSYSSSPAVTKTLVNDPSGIPAEVVRDANGEVISTTANIDGLSITGPTLHTEVSFPVKAPLGLTNNMYGQKAGNQANSDMKTFLNGNMRVMKSSTTALETGEY